MAALGYITASEKAVDDKGESTVKNKLENINEFVNDTYEEYINNDDNDYEVSVEHDSELADVVDLTEEDSNIEGYEAAVTAACDAVYNQEGYLTVSYDFCIVFDTRSLDANGGAEEGGIGEPELMTAWINNGTPKKSAAHELAHLIGYGESSFNSHNVFQNRFTRHTMMGVSGNDDCDNNKQFSLKNKEFAQCTVDLVRDKYDSNLS